MLDYVNLLWTGGWDSTFRLLQLLLVQNQPVQPYYVISAARQSSQHELAAMERIRQLLFQQHPHTKELLQPTIIQTVDALQPDDTIEQQYRALSSRQHLGNQYEYLARFATQAGISELELSIHKDDQAHKFLEPVVYKENGVFRLAKNLPDANLRLFTNFRFPVLELTKLDMKQQAVQFGFFELMQYTVFCHAPLKGGRPCGACNPCRYTIAEGLKERVPYSRRLRYEILRTIKPPVKTALRLLHLRQ